MILSSVAPDWTTLPRQRTYELVLLKIEDQILSGRLQAGDRLPSERDLAAELGVSRASVREAVRVLQAQGVVTSTVGTGPDSGTIITTVPSRALTRLVRLHVALASFDLAEVVEARVVLEISSVRLAAHDVTPAQLDDLADLLDQMSDPALPMAGFNDLDTRFHVILAEAASNRLVSELTIALRHALSQPLLDAFSDARDWTAVRESLMADHRALYEAVKAHDADVAARVVEQHIRGFFAHVLPAAPP